MRTKTLLAGAILFQTLCSAQPVRGQKATSEPAYPLIVLKLPMEAIPPIQYHQAPLPPPFAPQIAVAVREKCCGRSQPVQVELVNGTFWKGEVVKLNDLDSFDFRRRGSRKMERIHYRDVVAVTSIGPGFEEVAGKVGEYAGLVAFAVLMFPFIFVMGLGCNFHCS